MLARGGSSTVGSGDIAEERGNSPRGPRPGARHESYRGLLVNLPLEDHLVPSPEPWEQFGRRAESTLPARPEQISVAHQVLLSTRSAGERDTQSRWLTE